MEIVATENLVTSDDKYDSLRATKVVLLSSAVPSAGQGWTVQLLCTPPLVMCTASADCTRLYSTAKSAQDTGLEPDTDAALSRIHCTTVVV